MQIFATVCLLFWSFFKDAAADTQCPITPMTPGDRRTDKSKLRLMQYNAEWLFIDHYSAFDCPGTQCTWANQTDAQTHLQYVAGVIQTLNPDILNLCEVEGCDELNMLIQNLDNGKEYSPYLIAGTDTGTGQNVGMLTKIDPDISLYRTESRANYPIPQSECGSYLTPGSSSSGVSKHYITEFTIRNTQIAFISAHLIAIPTDTDRCAQREAQALVLQQQIAQYISKDYEVVVIGDFNDYDREIPDINNNQPTSKVLDILKGIYTIPNAAPDMKYQLFSVAQEVIHEKRFSDWWDSDDNCSTSSIHDYSMIDHILVSPFILQHIVDVFFFHGYKEYCGKFNSDHFPVVVDLLF
jgi:endonuclease/exonuclease/phosphatase family metal-dependent hydrolase